MRLRLGEQVRVPDVDPARYYCRYRCRPVRSGSDFHVEPGFAVEAEIERVERLGARVGVQRLDADRFRPSQARRDQHRADERGDEAQLQFGSL